MSPFQVPAQEAGWLRPVEVPSDPNSVLSTVSGSDTQIVPSAPSPTPQATARPVAGHWAITSPGAATTASAASRCAAVRATRALIASSARSARWLAVTRAPARPTRVDRTAAGLADGEVHRRRPVVGEGEVGRPRGALRQQPLERAGRHAARAVSSEKSATSRSSVSTTTWRDSVT